MIRWWTRVSPSSWIAAGAARRRSLPVRTATSDIRVTIRHIVEGRDAPRVIDAKTIDATSVRHELESDEETET
jgi:hypothetical protein